MSGRYLESPTPGRPKRVPNPRQLEMKVGVSLALRLGIRYAAQPTLPIGAALPAEEEKAFETEPQVRATRPS